jgi:hypothetical protein
MSIPPAFIQKKEQRLKPKFLTIILLSFVLKDIFAYFSKKKTYTWAHLSNFQIT